MNVDLKPNISHSEDAERAFLGCLCLDANKVLDTVDLDDGDFFDLKHREIYRAAKAVKARAARVDAVTLVAELGERGHTVGGLVYVSEIIGSVYDFEHAEDYAAIIASHALTRRIANAVTSALASGFEGEALAEGILSALSSVRMPRPDSTKTMSEAVEETLRGFHALVERRQRGETVTPGLATGLPSLDALSGGLHPGVVAILAGRPSHGKSSLARTIADNVSRAGNGVHVFTLEDSAEAYVYRALSDHSGVPLHRLRAVDVEARELAEVGKAADRLYQRKRWILDDAARLSSAQIAIRVKRHLASNQTRLVVVDYVQLMAERDGSRRFDKGEEVARAAEGLVQLARDEGLAVLLLSQLSRDCEKRDDKRPFLSDLRETGVLEQIADQVVFAFRPEMYLDKSARDSKTMALVEQWRNVGLAIVAKNKHGQTGEAKLRFDAPTATYRDLARVR